MKKTIIGIIIGGMIFGAIGVIAATTISSKNVTYQDKTVNNALDELYNEATTGKELVAAAITNKGIATTASDTYETMATNINSLNVVNTDKMGKSVLLGTTTSGTTTNVISHPDYKISDFRYIYIEISVGDIYPAMTPVELFKNRSVAVTYADSNNYKFNAIARYKSETETYLYNTSNYYTCRLYGIY